MPRGDGKGPPGGGQRSGGNRAGAGPGGICVCPSCGASAPHRQGVPCSSMKCPKGIENIRLSSYAASFSKSLMQDVPHVVEVDVAVSIEVMGLGQG